MVRPALALLVGALATGCYSTLRELDVQRRPPRRAHCAPAACADSVELTYLGVGGFVLRHGGQAIMTAPSFSHRGLVPVTVNWSVRSDSGAVDRGMARVDTSGVAAVLVGHAHYDHAMDLPRVAERWVPRARVYGSGTLKNILAGAPGLDTARLVSLDGDVGDSAHVGRWTYVPGGRIRFMPLRSSHAPNFLWITIANDEQRTARRDLPRSAWGWKKGPVYAYLIDVTDAADTTRPAFRVFYQDAAAKAEYAVLPKFAGADARPVDVAIVCVGNFDSYHSPRYPEPTLRALQPRHVVLGHWENFFRAPEPPFAVLPATKTRELVRRVEAVVGRSWVTLEPFASQRYLF
jgi:L-ascorbate metabolism protein UlaG (beta-lactamase superfamily)